MAADCTRCGDEIVLRRSKRLCQKRNNPSELCVSCEKFARKRSRWNKSYQEQILRLCPPLEPVDVTDDQVAFEPVIHHPPKEKAYTFYPMGKLTRAKALRADRTTPYSIMGYKYEENGIVFLTTEEAGTSKRLTRQESDDIKAWIDNGMSPPIFDAIEDGIYMHPAISMEGCVHVRDKSPRTDNWGFVYTYVPVTFLKSL